MSTIESPYVLGIAEKPQAARRLARALDEKSKPQLKKMRGVSVFICQRGNKKIVIAPAIGHLFSISPISKTWNYPVLDYEWVPSYIVDKNARTKNFIDIFKILAKGADEVIIMTDYDREGEVIGYLILKLLLGKEQAERMKFSTLTRRDIISAYDKREKELDVGFLNSGLLRHYVDWLYGINYSRALSLSLRRVSGRFKTISIGRVQGPTLGSVVNLEEELNLFVPIPFWTIESEVTIENKRFKAYYEKARIETQKQAIHIEQECESLVGYVFNVSNEEKNMFPFPPFNLGDLQRESYKHFRFSPSKTLEIAEKLYLSAMISYPRTDSQKLPMSLGHKTILKKLSEQIEYGSFATEIISRKKFKPREGRKSDAAHPAIHPTGNKPAKNLIANERKIYDLIVKRYLSIFGEKAIILKKVIEIKINNHKFEVRGSQILSEGWVKYYKPYFSLEESIVPNVELNSKISFDFVMSKEHFSTPPRRFNESTLLNKMEEEKIGTKATRAGIIKTLFDRGYVQGHVIQPTPLGFAVVDVLQDHYPVLIRAEMTRELENIMESVQNKKMEIEEVVLSIKKELKSLLTQFHKKENEIGLSLYQNLQQSEESKIIVIGKCHQCKVGELRIIKSRKTGKRFIACSSYFDKSIKCNVTFPIPATGTIKPTNKLCKHDNLPIIEWQKGRKKQFMCVSPDCPSKKKGKTDEK
ncbi:MAG: DNA topoisomerase I [Candidatus Heimdallarchaeota archaeon]|nr:DNA topoisomerase I [Candidatus Heimdallarchaeota archaeon]MCK4955247.1 DNA topoisomerase I [Candidatus Heimdallarchaeota archaeon]